MSKKQEIIKIGDVEFRVLFPNLFAEEETDEYERLSSSIKEIGVTVPVITDEEKGVIDGKRRLRASAEHNKKSVPFFILPGLDDNEKKHLAIMLNAQRRHLTKEERLALATDLRRDGLSYRQIADILNVHHETIRRQLATVAGATDEFPEKVRGKDGKLRPAKVKCKPKKCILAKSIAEVKRVFDACDEIDSTDLPNSTIDVKRAEKIARQVKVEKRREQEYEDLKVGQVELLLGDFRIKGQYEIPDSSVDVIFTDPLYEKNALPIWNDLGEIASKKLKPGGILLAYSGVLYLNQVYRMLDKHLEYLWTAAIEHTGRIKLVRAVQIFQAWKPILIYHKPPLSKYWQPFRDMVSGGQEKEHHHYEQAVGEALHYIQAFCPRNSVLWDPMAGSATTIIAGLEADLGLKLIACELDKAAYATAETRVKEAIEKLQARKEAV
jgi:DNA modification methylase/DNA-binding CsgD family transcriptional regulator